LIEELPDPITKNNCIGFFTKNTWSNSDVDKLFLKMMAKTPNNIIFAARRIRAGLTDDIRRDLDRMLIGRLDLYALTNNPEQLNHYDKSGKIEVF
jgi:hypothetical protein